jgi:hypothetical protein
MPDLPQPTPASEQLEDFFTEKVEPLIEKAEAFGAPTSKEYCEALVKTCQEISAMIGDIEDRVAKANEPLIKRHKEVLAAKDALIEPLNEVISKLFKLLDDSPWKDEKFEGLQHRGLVKFEVTDPKQVPLQYLQPDMKAIGAAIRKTGGAIPIPGVRAWTETIKVVRQSQQEGEKGEA